MKTLLSKDFKMIGQLENAVMAMLEDGWTIDDILDRVIKIDAIFIEPPGSLT